MNYRREVKTDDDKDAANSDNVDYCCYNNNTMAATTTEITTLNPDPDETKCNKILGRSQLPKSFNLKAGQHALAIYTVREASN